MKAGRPTDKIFLIKAGVCEKIREIDPLDEGGPGQLPRPGTPATPGRAAAAANGASQRSHSQWAGSGSGRHAVSATGGRFARLEQLGTMTAGELVWGQASDLRGAPRLDERIRRGALGPSSRPLRAPASRPPARAAAGFTERGLCSSHPCSPVPSTQYPRGDASEGRGPPQRPRHVHPRERPGAKRQRPRSSLSFSPAPPRSLPPHSGPWRPPRAAGVAKGGGLLPPAVAVEGPDRRPRRPRGQDPQEGRALAHAVIQLLGRRGQVRGPLRCFLLSSRRCCPSPRRAG